jgi:uncharacterized protein (DUF2147 family)
LKRAASVVSAGAAQLSVPPPAAERSAVRLGCCLLLVLGVLGPPAAPDARAAELNSPVGRWQILDEDSHTPRAVVEMTLVDGELQGRTVQSFLRPGEPPDARCVRCEGERKNQPMLGMVILWGLRADGADWQGGHVLDPTTGRTYRASVTLIEGGTKLRVHGFIGLSLFGRSQTWLRLE